MPIAGVLGAIGGVAGGAGSALASIAPGLVGTVAGAALSRAIGGGSSGGTVSQASTLTPDQQKVVKEYLNWLSPQIGQAGPVYGGQRVAGLSPLQEQAFGMAGQIPGLAQQNLGAGMGALQNILGYDPKTLFDPYRQLATSTWQQDIAPDIMARFGGSADSSATRRALAQAGQRLSLGLATELAPYEMEARSQQIQGAGQLANLQGAYGNIAQQLAGLGEAQRGYGQENIQAAMQQWQESQPYANPYVRMLSNVLPFGQPWVENIVSPSQPGLGESLAPIIIPPISQAIQGGIQNWLTPKSTGLSPLALTTLNTGWIP